MVLTSHELVPKLQCCVDLKHLHNIDLFSTGYYQLRCHLRTASGPPSRVDVQLLRTAGKAAGLFPASVIDGAAASQTVELAFADERLPLDDRINFDVTLGTRVEKLSWIEMVLTMELWHMDKDEMLQKAAGTCDMHDCFKRLSSRCVRLRVWPARGLHTHRPIVFDYYHLCSVATTVHVSTVGLLQRCRHPGKLELTRRVSTCNEEKVRLVHRTACLLLLQAYESIQLRIRAYSKLLRHGNIIRIQMVDTVLKLDALYRRFDSADCDDKLAALSDDVQLLSQELTVLWTQFLELFRGSDEVAQALANEHNLTRVKRFGEAFFYSEDTVHGLLSSSFISSTGSSIAAQSARVAELARKSAYLCDLPHLPCAVPETDGTGASTPVIFEYKYVPAPAAAAVQRLKGDGEDKKRRSRDSWSDADGGSVRRLKDCLNLELRQCARPAKQPQNDSGANSKRDSSLQPTKRSQLQVSNSSAATSSVASSTSSLTAGSRRRSVDGAGVYCVTDADVSQVGFELDVDGTLSGALAALHRSCTEPNLSVDRERALPSTATTPSAAGQEFSVNDLITDSMVGGSTRSVAVGRLPASVEDGAIEKEVYLPVEERLLRGAAKDGRRSGRSRLCAALKLKSASLRVKSTSKKYRAGSCDRRPSTKRNDDASESAAVCAKTPDTPPDAVAQLTAMVDSTLVRFVTNKEAFKAKLALTGYAGHLYSDFRSRPSAGDHALTRLAPAWTRRQAVGLRADDAHVVVCVHGLEGSRDDLRPYVNCLKLMCPDERFDFLMSEANELSTYECFERLGENLLQEVIAHVERYPTFSGKISFIAHSMGAIVVRAAVADVRFAPHLARLHCFLSLNGPHGGLLLNQKTASLGVSLVQWWKRSASLEQLCLRDCKADYRQSFLYTLSQSPSIAAFRYVLLVGSAADLYVPWQSALLLPSKPAQGKQAAQIGAIYNEMAANVATCVASAATAGAGCTLARYLCYHGRSADVPRSQHILGRAAHVAPLDDDVFVEKLLTVSVASYFADQPS